MLFNFRLVATGLGALAACAQALDMTNLTIDEIGCGTPSLSLEQWTHSEQVLAQEKDTTKRQEAQVHRIPVHITVLAKNSTVNGGNIDDSQIQQVLDQVNKYYSYGFYLDTSVDTIHRYLRPDLFHPESGQFTGDFHNVQKQYHRGEGDYASLNLIFLFRLEDWYKVETTTERQPNGATRTSTRWSSGGTMGWSTIPTAEIWKYSNALDIEKRDGMVVSSATIPDMAYPGHGGSLSTFAHEFGHWVGLEHTDHSKLKDDWGRQVPCDPENDGIEDTPTHMLDENEKEKQEKEKQEKEKQEKEKQEKEKQEKEKQEKEKQEKEKQEKEPHEKEQQDQQPQDQQPQDKQGDWRQQQVARLQSESNKAWDDFRREQAKYRQQMQQTGQRNLNDCFSQVDQDYKQRRESINGSVREKYNQLQADRNGLWKWLEQYRRQPQHRQWAEDEWNRQEKEFAGRRQGYQQEERGYWQDLERDSQKRQESCRQWAKEQQASGLQELKKWEEEYVKVLRDNDSRAQQYINSL
ncbi:hypothetical protein MY10362_009250 [Beauveria mimosiformis]